MKLPLLAAPLKSSKEIKEFFMGEDYENIFNNIQNTCCRLREMTETRPEQASTFRQDLRKGLNFAVTPKEVLV